MNGAAPDGICLDAEGAIWLASPVSREVLRVRQGGEVTHRCATPGQAVACMLGGPDMRTLFVLTTKVMLAPEESLKTLPGAIHTLAVDVPGFSARLLQPRLSTASTPMGLSATKSRCAL